jgi:hypothetical protein
MRSIDSVRFESAGEGPVSCAAPLASWSNGRLRR